MGSPIDKVKRSSKISPNFEAEGEPDTSAGLKEIGNSGSPIK